MAGRNLLQEIRVLTLVAATLSLPNAVFAQRGDTASETRPVAPQQSQAQLVGTETRTPALVPLGHATLSFEENRGQADSRIEFLSQGRGYNVLLTEDEMVLALLGTRAKTSGDTGAGAILRMRLADADTASEIAGLEPLPGMVYYADALSNGPLTAHSTFRRVKYTSVYPGIDLVYYGNDGKLEFDFEVSPGADPRQIRLAFEGADEVRLDPAGELVVPVAGHEVRVKKPVIYQGRDGARTEVAGRYAIDRSDGHEVRIEIGEYDSRLPLTIDPVIAFATYFGGAGTDVPVDLEVNASGEIYLFGLSNDFASLPTTTTFPLAPPWLAFECFLSKLAADGSTLLYSVHFGGISSCADMAPDGHGQVHLSMGSGVNMLRTLSEDGGGGLSLGLLKGVFDFPNGPAQHLAVDAAGDVYFTVFHIPSEAPDGRYDLFKVGDSGLVGSIPIVSPFVDHTQTPAEKIDRLTGLTVDDLGRATAIGWTRSTSSTGVARSVPLIAPTPNALQPAPLDTCCQDGFLVQIDTNTGGPFQVTYASYVGGSHAEYLADIAHDAAGAVYIAGESRSPDFPTSAGAWAEPRTDGLYDAFVLKLDLSQPAGQQIAFGTFLGGTAGAGALSIAVLPGDLTVISGHAFDFGFPLVNPLYSSIVSTPRAFVSAFAPDGTALVFSTFLDDAGSSANPVVATNGSQFIHTAAEVTEDGLGTPGAYREHVAGGYDVLLQKIDASDFLPANDPPEIALPPDLDVVATSPAGAFVDFDCGICSIVDPDGDALTRFTLTRPDGSTMSSPDSPPFDRILLPIGSHTFELEVEDARGAIGAATWRVNVLGQNTFSGGVPIAPRNDNFFDIRQINLVTPVTVTFEDVINPGLTWMTTRVDQNPPVPPHLQAGTPPVYFDIFTNAGFTGPIQVCLDIRGVSFADPGSIQMYRHDGASWHGLASSPQGTSLCAQTDALDTSFAIFYQPVPATAITTIAGTGFYQGEIDGDPFGGPDARDNFIDGGPATTAALGTIFGGAVDRTRNALYFTSGYLAGGAVFRLDLQTNALTRVAGHAHRPFGIDGPGGDLSDDPQDGTQALQYPLNAPGAIAVDGAGNVYFTERLLPVENVAGFEFCGVLKYDPAQHTITRVAGIPAAPSACGFSGDNGPANAARVQEMRALAVDRLGNLFLGDERNVRIRRVDALTGDITTVAGDGGNAEFISLPQEALEASLQGFFGGLAFDAQGHLVVSQGNLWRIAPGPDGLIKGRVGAGEIITPLFACGPAPLPPCQNWPLGGDGLTIDQTMDLVGGAVTVLSDGSILHLTNGRVRRVRPGADGIVTGGDPGELIETIAGFEYDVTLPVFGGVNGGGSGFFNGDRYATNSTLAFPLGAAEEASGRVLIVDTNNRRIRRIGPRGGVPADTTPPVLSLPGDLTVEATTASGAAASFSATATDDVSGDVPVICTPVSGSEFPFVSPGPTTTPVTCSATDAAGNTANGSFTVTVTARPPVLIAIGERVTITDTLGVRRSAMLAVSERVTVTDTLTILPSALLTITEPITVSDASVVRGPAIVTLVEHVTVSDTIGLVPSAIVSVAEPIRVTDTPNVVIAAPSCAAAAGPEIRVTRSGFRLNRATGFYVQTVTLQNVGAAAVAGPVSLVLDALSTNVSLVSPAGVTSCGTATGSPYLHAPLGASNAMAPGQSVTLTLNFSNPQNRNIAYTTRVLVGSGPR